ncbi:MAG: hypothetical protein EU533_06205 [Promethearchaeota archaeon]|nr:MAG: hypothetical protein EU533_06205 [Candidatus Lokiarchaeota archaeon]
MISFSYNRPPPWFFQFAEHHAHFFLDIKFNKQNELNDFLKFSVQLEMRGFEGLLFYIYQESDTKIVFDVIDYKLHDLKTIENLNLKLNPNAKIQSVDFAILPFGQFKEDNKLHFSVECKECQSSFQIFSWMPSLLFKNVKSIIKIDNKYEELIPLDDTHGYYYHFDYSFKGNKTEMLFGLINTLCDFDTNTSYESSVDDIKRIISKSNEYLFEISEKTVPIDLKSILKELERLKFNLDSLTKEEIFNWIDDIINYYSN